MRQHQSDSSLKKTGILWRILIYYCKITKEFLRATILNGLKYLTFKYLSVWEKLFFLVCFITAFYNSYNFAINIVEKWQISPVMTSMNPRTSVITNEPFPALTICNMNRAQHDKVKDFNVESLEFAMLQKLCFQEINYTSFADKHQHYKNETFASFIVKNTQSCSHMLAVCEYGNLKITCSDPFREVLIDEGMCCAFNIVHPYLLYKGDYFIVRDYTSIDRPIIPIDWSLEKGYPKVLAKDSYPRKALGAGMSNGLTITLHGDYDNHYCSSTNGAGFKIAVHNPIHTPNIRESGISIPLGYQTSLRINPLREESDETLRTSTEPKQRQCFFSDEYPLQYFRYYSRDNCEMECDARFMERKCNCILYHMPVVSTNVSKCHVQHFDCVIAAEKDYGDPTLLSCKKECLSNCNELSYFPKASFLELENTGFAIRNPFLRRMSKESLQKYAVLQVFFTEKYYRGNVKYPYMGLTEFLSQVGGIMSLMTGFSIISLVEIVYFFVIKPFIFVWRKIFHKNMIHLININSTNKYENHQQRYPVGKVNVFSLQNKNME